MSLVDMDSWVTEHDSCERLGHLITAQIVERNQQKPLSSEYTKISANVRLRLRQFELELKELNTKLTAVTQKGSITFQEIERRRRQIEILQTTYKQLQFKFSKSENVINITETTERNQLLGVKSALWEEDDDDDDEPLIHTQNINFKPQKQLSNILSNQDQGLEALSATISRQKLLSTKLGEEICVQNEIIENIAENIEDLDIRVNRQTRNIGEINQRDNTCCYWIAIISLFITICVVAVIA